MKTLPLIKSHLKGFLRNWKSVLLLLGVPLILVFLIVASFNTQGTAPVPFGIVEQEALDLFQYEDSYLSFLDMKPHPNLDSCLAAVYQYEEYGCIEVRMQNAKTVITVHYDNTKEPIIWEILQRIETSVEILQQQQSEVALNSLLSETASTQESVQYFEEGIISTGNKLDEYSLELIQLNRDVISAQQDLQENLDQMEQDLDEIQEEINQIDEDRQESYSESMQFVQDARQVETALPPGQARSNFSVFITQINNEINSYNLQTYASVQDSRRKVANYRRAHAQGEQYVDDLDDLSDQLEVTQRDIQNQKQQLATYQQELHGVSAQLSSLGNTNTDRLLKSVMLTSQAIFIPEFDVPEDIQDISIEEVNQAQSLMSLQTLYPTILFLVLLFLSLLIATFLCLQEINSAASSRIRLIPNMFGREFFSTYVSSLIIAFIPVFCVLIAGEYLFALDILSSIITISLITLLISSCFIFLGMSIAYVLRKESITLLLSTFLLVFFMFFSGFLYPIERMNPFFGAVANALPPKIGLSAFNQAVFYNQSLLQVSDQIWGLVIWLILLGCVAMCMKFIRRQ